MSFRVLLSFRSLLTLTLSVALLACSSSDNPPPPDAGKVDASKVDASKVDASQADGPRADVGVADSGPLTCFEFSLDPNVPLAIDGTFVATSPLWRRPHDEPEVCPATALLPTDKAQVPFVAYAFCNKDSKAHTFNFEMLADTGPKGETPLDDPYLVLYDGQQIPADAKQCKAINDNIPDTLNVNDSEILGISVPPGGAITMVGTTWTFDPTDGTGQGYYVLVVTVAD